MGDRKLLRSIARHRRKHRMDDRRRYALSLSAQFPIDGRTAAELLAELERRIQVQLVQGRKPSRYCVFGQMRGDP